MSSTDDEQLGRLCEVLNAHHVVYVIFGSFAGRLQGADLHTVDVDIVPDRSEYNLQRLCDALNSLSPRGENRVKIGSIDDLIRSKEILGREKDREHLADLRARQAELDLERGKHRDPGDDLGLGL